MSNNRGVFECVAALLVAAMLTGCGTTYSVVRQEQRLARIKVTSDPDGATIYVNRTPTGKTPTQVQIPYQEIEQEVSSGKRKTGIWLLTTGAAGVAAGIGLLFWGIDALSSSSDSSSPDTSSVLGGTFGTTFGGVGALYGLFGVIAGIYMLATSESIPNKIETTPAQLSLGLNVPGEGMKEAVLSAINPEDKSPPFDQVKAIHYAMERGAWTAPDLPPRLQLVGTGQGGRPAVTAARRRPRPAAGRRAPIIIAVFNIEDRGANLSDPMLVRLSDYLSMKIAATGRYQVIPRDQLKERLVAQKKDSYKSCFDQSCQIEVGKELAAQKSLSTMVVKLGSKCSVTSVLYDLRKATSEGGASASGGCDEDGIVATLEDVVKQLAPR